MTRKRAIAAVRCARSATHSARLVAVAYKIPQAKQMVTDRRGDTLRAVYAVRFADAVYVLHAFQEKVKVRHRYAKKEMDLIRQRLAEAERNHIEEGRCKRHGVFGHFCVSNVQRNPRLGRLISKFLKLTYFHV